MIKLEIEPYCHECPNFVATVKKVVACIPDKPDMRYRKIVCENSHICAGISRYLKSVMEKEKMYKGNPFRKDVEYPINYLGRIELSKDDIPDCLNYDPFKDIYERITKIKAKVINMADEAIYSAIIEEAKEAGVTDLFLIDKEFVLTALTNEMERRVDMVFALKKEKENGNLE